MKRIFLSHIHEEVALVRTVKKWIEHHFPGQVDVFVSSDYESLAAGEKWLSEVEKVLFDVKLLIVLCSRDAAKRSWVNFEAGAAWTKGVAIIPLCHSDMSRHDLPTPLSIFQAIDLSDATACQSLTESIAKHLQLDLPQDTQYEEMEQEILLAAQGMADGGRTVDRIALWGTTTREVERSAKKRKAISRFHKSLLLNIERTSYGLNACGAEPLRSAFFERYCERLFLQPAEHLSDLSWRVRWFWFAGDDLGFSYAPGYWENVRATDGIERNELEIAASQLIVACAGRTGTLEQVRRLFQWHQDSTRGIDLMSKPLVLLGWFGGTVGRFISEHREAIQWLLDLYPELDPADEVPAWEDGDRVEELAQRLVETIQRLLSTPRGIAG